ncbi:MauE/DoxX family redox-associated membrane protein [Streptomyces sp. NRRL B-3648]|uniref:MauE/DoxX family redox-associated membrane protein n=1 Tax=Streptomyces sp. NRRL B-3648 TaxID=1519493 RepID=UPI00099DD113|nr:MauE/DoxX family redox-associated membrane protein [Streptomyces sp. NRRL B-3648]
MRVDFLSSTCQGLLALVFTGACVSKVRTAASFAAVSDTVVTLGRVPRRLAGGLAGGIVSLEALTALCLAVPALHGVGLAAAAVLLTGFTYAIARALRDGDRVTCHCFGTSGDRPAGWPQIVRNSLLLTAVAAAVPGTQGGHSLSWQGVFSAWLIGAVCAVVVATGEEIVSLVRHGRPPLPYGAFRTTSPN